jgi:hypothetical protein
VAVPLTEPNEAVIVTVPSATAVTSPADDTVAIDELDVAHATVAPPIVLPSVSFTVGTSVVVSPNEAKLRLVGASVIEAAACDTVTVAASLAEPNEAVMVAVPSATAVTSPAEDTVAIDEFDVVHATVAAEIVFPPASLTVATNDAVSPNDVKLKLLGTSSMIAAA